MIVIFIQQVCHFCFFILSFLPLPPSTLSPLSLSLCLSVSLSLCLSVLFSFIVMFKGIHSPEVSAVLCDDIISFHACLLY